MPSQPTTYHGSLPRRRGARLLGAGNRNDAEETLVMSPGCHFLLGHRFRLELGWILPRGVLPSDSAGIRVARLDLEEGFLAQFGQVIAHLRPHLRPEELLLNLTLDLLQLR